MKISREQREYYVGTPVTGPTSPAPRSGVPLTRADLRSNLDSLRRKAVAPTPDRVPLSSAVSAFFSRVRGKLLGRVWGRGSKSRVFIEFSWLVPRLLSEWDDLRPWGTRLYWWSFGAFAKMSLLEGNQYLAGRRAPPLLLR